MNVALHAQKKSAIGPLTLSPRPVRNSTYVKKQNKIICYLVRK